MPRFSQMFLISSSVLSKREWKSVILVEWIARHFLPSHNESDTPSVTKIKCSELGNNCKGAGKSTFTCRVAYQSKQQGPRTPELKKALFNYIGTNSFITSSKMRQKPPSLS
ncbi:hypothetical protein VNO80_21775 [Phaseolus coccineus]|uniref:Uncharacterized protein n=1 Tax=Phaseolus coccineus TaxID=3886 RepID=A0AAN9M8C2_PHACN